MLLRYIDSKGLIKAIGKKVSNGNIPSEADKIDVKKESIEAFIGKIVHEVLEKIYSKDLTFGICSIVIGSKSNSTK